MKTQELIVDLKKDLLPYRGAETTSQFLTKVFLLAGVLTLLAWFILPVREDFQTKISMTGYQVSSLLWLVSGICSVLMVYRSSIIGLDIGKYERLALFSFVAVAISVPLGADAPVTDYHYEFDLVQGICGGLITAIALTGAGFLFYWSRKQSPTDYLKTGFWVAMSTACLGSFVMQFVCAHDTAFHIYLWHFLPTLVLAGIGAWAGKRLLKW